MQCAAPISHQAQRIVLNGAVSRSGVSRMSENRSAPRYRSRRREIVGVEGVDIVLTARCDGGDACVRPVFQQIGYDAVAVVGVHRAVDVQKLGGGLHVACHKPSHGGVFERLCFGEPLHLLGRATAYQHHGSEFFACGCRVIGKRYGKWSDILQCFLTKTLQGVEAAAADGCRIASRHVGGHNGILLSLAK